MRPLLSWKALGIGLIGLVVALLVWPRKVKAPSGTVGLCQAPTEEYATELGRLRQLKDSLLQVDPTSPIPAEERQRFTGLRYFPADPSWRLKGRYEPLPNALAPVVGAVWVPLPAYPSCKPPARLLVYGEKDGRLYVAFWDSTAAQGLSYEGGRYVPLERFGDSACLDFNRAYFPYCAYNPHYICLPYPPENRLCVPILAGERW